MDYHSKDCHQGVLLWRQLVSLDNPETVCRSHFVSLNLHKESLTAWIRSTPTTCAHHPLKILVLMTAYNSPLRDLTERINIVEVRGSPHYAAASTLPSELTFWEGGAGGDRLIPESEKDGFEPPSAVLRIIVQISRSGHFLRPTGTYIPSSKLANDNVTKAKLRFAINAPKDPRFGRCADDYSQFNKNLRAIQTNAARPSGQSECHRAEQ